ncbi:hypothetical protein [Nocardia abscessus]|uniref:hypothetical protein n=1 Tax=Nocardia abscessus TaxID=120957 RepID=UPI0024541F60|nr:hypothetical protein [Nocardia abscessus]
MAVELLVPELVGDVSVDYAGLLEESVAGVACAAVGGQCGGRDQAAGGVVADRVEDDELCGGVGQRVVEGVAVEVVTRFDDAADDEVVHGSGQGRQHRPDQFGIGRAGCGHPDSVHGIAECGRHRDEVTE